MFCPILKFKWIQNRKNLIQIYQKEIRMISLESQGSSALINEILKMKNYEFVWKMNDTYINILKLML